MISTIAKPPNTLSDGKATSFVVMVSKSPFDSRNAESALHFCRAALQAGHLIDHVFFYQSGVSNASHLLNPNNDEINTYQQWSEFKKLYKVPLRVCVTAAARRGVVDKQWVEQIEQANLKAPFEQVGLGEYFAAIANGAVSIQL